MLSNRFVIVICDDLLLFLYLHVIYEVTLHLLFLQTITIFFNTLGNNGLACLLVVGLFLLLFILIGIFNITNFPTTITIIVIVVIMYPPLAPIHISVIFIVLHKLCLMLLHIVHSNLTHCIILPFHFHPYPY